MIHNVSVKMMKILRKCYVFLPQAIVECTLEKKNRQLNRDIKSAAAGRPAFIKAQNGLPFTFVLLQFNHAEMTMECIEAILKLDEFMPIRIVVVDNASTDDALNKIRGYAEGKENVKIIELETNCGFAMGNNVGYKYARNVIGSEFIVVMNNDVVINDKEILKKAVTEYNKSAYSILGPDIVVPGNRPVHQNPLGYHLKTEHETRMFLEKYSKRLEALEKGVFKLRPTSPYGHRIKDPYRRTGFIVLHGAAYIFSPIFVKDFEYPFDEGTFLYGEENILALRTLYKGHKILYAPAIQVIHKTKSSSDTSRLADYYKFRYQNYIRSYSVYRNMISNPGDVAKNREQG